MEKVWEPHPGSQTLFLTCPYKEALYDGTRGPGKSDALIMDFAQHVGQGYGSYWRGILFRQTFKQLGDIVVKAKRWFSKIFPAAKFLESAQSYKWVWPGGEELLFREFKKPDDYWNYHGHEYPWQGWEELTTWPDLNGYDMMKSCCRSSCPIPGMPRKIRATTNPWGKGHNVVKARFVDGAPPGVPILEPTKIINGITIPGDWRVRIHGHWSENTHLMTADPTYLSNIASDRNENRRKAWLLGDWHIVAGGMFDDLWREDVHVIAPFKIPQSWYVDRAYDWGSSKPFSHGLWAESDGTKAPNGITYPPGTLIRCGEWYGWNGEPNEGLKLSDAAIAKGIKERDAKNKWIEGRVVRPGPADSMIFQVSNNGYCVHMEMKKNGVAYVEADKRPGSRKNRWSLLRGRFEASLQSPMENPGIFVFEDCRQFIRTMPVLPRDESDPDDVDTETEDHIADETGYRVLHKKAVAQLTPLTGW